MAVSYVWAKYIDHDLDLLLKVKRNSYLRKLCRIIILLLVLISLNETIQRKRGLLLSFLASLVKMQNEESDINISEQKSSDCIVI